MTADATPGRRRGVAPHRRGVRPRRPGPPQPPWPAHPALDPRPPGRGARPPRRPRRHPPRAGRLPSDRPSRPGGAGLQQHLERRLVEDGDAEAARPCRPWSRGCRRRRRSRSSSTPRTTPCRRGARIASLAPSRLKSTSEPVTTTVRPSRVRSVDSSRSSSIETPAASHLSTIARCQSTLEPLDHRLGDGRPHALGGGQLLARSPRGCAAIEPNSAASARAAVGPDVPDRQRDEDPPQGHVLAHAEVGQQALAVGAELAAPPRPSWARG